MEKNFSIKNISTHSLRHTYCTRCIEAGLEPIVVANLLGQSDVEMVYNVYTDVQEKFKTEELNKINQYYMNKNFIENDMPRLDSTDKNDERQ